MKQLFKKSGLEGDVKFEKGTLWHTKISVNPDDLDDTAEQIVDKVQRLFRVVTEFEKWLQVQKFSFT